MAAYLIGRMSIVDPDQYNEYKQLTPGIIEKFGGRFLSRGGERMHLEGVLDDRRVVLVEFKSVDAAKTFYESPEYTYARTLRNGAAIDMQLVVVEGFEAHQTVAPRLD
ncbi:DUF1330 domain-containing protein [Variovorax sp. RB2P76]|jgi:uncharacterized protein (DUF1330 family)|uniref:DUF1330 domain-containing protein n=1 Tax=unclassified Variovorax TaxID=663243 RepID=UPI003F45287A